jgi:hypothetical protein
MLKSSTFFASPAAVLGLSASEQMHISYYSDHGCTSYIGEVDVNRASDMTGGSNCYNYHYGASMSLASCSETYCMCMVYYDSDCQGDYPIMVNGMSERGACIQLAGEYNSFQCFYSNL